MEKTETAIMFAYSELCTTIDEQRPLEQRKSFLSRVFRQIPVGFSTKSSHIKNIV